MHEPPSLHARNPHTGNLLFSFADIFHDKKAVGGKVKWILMESIGQVCGNSNVPEEIVKGAMQKIV